MQGRERKRERGREGGRERERERGGGREGGREIQCIILEEMQLYIMCMAAALSIIIHT